jgi:hypothetical protein
MSVVTIGGHRSLSETHSAPDVTLYVGAGGGGDTVAAALRALADGGGAERKVIGAGYPRSQYTDTLVKKNTASLDTIDGYVSGVIEESDVPGIFALKPPDAACEANKAVVFADRGELDATYGVPTYETESSSYKYKTLLEESTFLHHVDMGAVECFMAVTSDSMNAAADAQLDAFQDFVVHHKVREIVLIDFGGDVFDLKPVISKARDAVFLTVILLVMKRLAAQGRSLTLRVEVYGPNVDMHDADGAASVIKKLMKAGVSVKAGHTTAMYSIMKAKAILGTMLGLLGPGRATGNWLAAADGAVPFSRYVSEYLMARKDYKDLLAKDPTKAIELAEKAHETLLGDYGRVFTYSSNDWRYYESIIPITSETHNWLSK